MSAFPENSSLETERSNGILPAQSIRALIEARAIFAPDSVPFGDAQIQPASVDLRLGAQAFHVRASFLPGKSATVLEKIHDGLLIDTIDLRQPTGDITGTKLDAVALSLTPGPVPEKMPLQPVLSIGKPSAAAKHVNRSRFERALTTSAPIKAIAARLA